MHRLPGIGPAVLLAAAFVPAPARAETPADFLAAFEQSARTGDAAFNGFSARRGRQFFQTAICTQPKVISANAPSRCLDRRES